MSAWSNRNLAAMLKEQKASPGAAALLGDKTRNGDVPKRPVVSVEPAPKFTAPTAAAVVTTGSEPTPEPAAGPEVVYTLIGPVSMPQALAKLVMPSEFRFAGTVEARKPVALQPPVTRQPAEVVPTPAVITPPMPVEALPVPTVTSSSDLQRTPSPKQQEQHHHHQWNPPQPVYNPSVNDYVPQYEGARPYGGELGSVPLFYSTERQYNAQPYHPTYYNLYCSGGYSSSAIQYGEHGDIYHSYYPGQCGSYTGSRLQTRPPYYPPRDPPPQQNPATQYN
ncbi:conserved hypothetical protein [Leishmania braziliensis MHOM/BR/75/M2904]|uniref:Uncharacterized protein n=2 Tax=Leishmania braziliensis TaxID=5660 RepID=E9AIL8_LEIBR|nr:conserved hypothetical protein [Leishmania braziliensis MHOM/BR/75/M2904]CAJ2472137.1 unnamed protein product [Leishmania braziliensis]CBZ14663.1 conserved hypothetical protein [Leishmania braziliensis MHOM/BR/75/M2904]SYZ65598.1 hypothetical_protein [Leishmania braziliensis MHOM/BR/75/M2904]